MKINILGLHLLSAASYAALKQTVSDEGHELVEAGTDEVTHLETVVAQQFPDVISDIQNGIADLKDSTLSGGEKAVKVATDVLATAPDALKEMAGAKDFFVSLVTKEFAKGIPALVEGAAKLVGELVKDVTGSGATAAATGETIAASGTTAA